MVEIYGSLWSEGTTTTTSEESQEAIDPKNLMCFCIWDDAWDVVIDMSAVELYCESDSVIWRKSLSVESNKRTK